MSNEQQRLSLEEVLRIAERIDYDVTRWHPDGSGLLPGVIDLDRIEEIRQSVIEAEKILAEDHELREGLRKLFRDDPDGS